MRRLAPRRIHPGAWWLWALGLATAAAHTTDVVLLGIIAGAAALAVVRCGDARARSAFRFYCGIALFILVMRVAFRVVFGGAAVGPPLLTLPEVPLPGWASGVRLGGPVTALELWGAFVDGARLATIVLCVGAANALADPRRLLRVLPQALRRVGTAVVVAVSLAPQIVASARRVTRAMALRTVASGRRTGRLIRLAGPVVEDALARTMTLATAMEVRGFGAAPARPHRAVPVFMVAGTAARCGGMFGILDSGAPPLTGAPLLVAGALLIGAGIHLAGQSRHVTVYRRDPWRGTETLLVLSGIAVAAGFVALSFADPLQMLPTGPPATPLTGVSVAILATLPAWVAPPTPAPFQAPRGVAP